MLFASILAFLLGIYIEAVFAPPLLFPFLSLVILIPALYFMMKREGLFPLCGISLLCLFFCTGMVRMGITMKGNDIQIDGSKGVYRCIVVQSSPKTKIVEIVSPTPYKRLRVLYRSEKDYKINDTIEITGSLSPIGETFKNPYTPSWKWMKRTEGVFYELKGDVVALYKGKNYAHMWRNFLKKRIEGSGAKSPEIISAITIGDTTGLKEETRNLFLTTGTSHILSISGSHIGIITAFFFFLSKWLWGRYYIFRLNGNDKRYASLTTILFAFLFMLTAGADTPVVRATIMVVIFMLSIFFERGKSLLNTIALSGLVILLLFPHSLFTAKFQLTFVSVISITIFAERLSPFFKIKNLLVKWVITTAAITLFAFLGTMPIVIYHFYGINPFSIIHNLFAIPLICIIALPLALIGIVAPYGTYVLKIAGEVIDISLWLLKHLNFGYIYPVIRPNLTEILLYFAFLFSIVYIRRRPVAILLFGLIIPLSIFHSYTVYKDRYNDNLCFHFIDVGPGEAMLVEAPSGVRLLIDGGGFYNLDYDIGKSVLTPILLSKKILTIDYLINTHPHIDHIGGLPYIARYFNVKRFAAGGIYTEDQRFMGIIRDVEERGGRFLLLNRGDKIYLEGNTTIEVLNPVRGMFYSNLNNASVVMKLTYKGVSFLLPGDIEKEVEEMLIDSKTPLKANILKIPHHGSRSSSSLPFLLNVRPDLAVLSTGKGITGLPSREVIERYRVLSIPVLRTDKDGFISICTDGRKIYYKTYIE
ncbi:MAG: DNA internalization-related competence protein ComEC/Rec2 [Syntrophorhabdaceae bacterium]|nr:DNA internalization-related competence protein ComEC/Rec2 [Syntrophorhabdaceae bacterium]